MMTNDDVFITPSGPATNAPWCLPEKLALYKSFTFFLPYLLQISIQVSVDKTIDKKAESPHDKAK